jgi:glycosyltransferase involved in cell wall biosynthesis
MLTHPAAAASTTEPLAVSRVRAAAPSLRIAFLIDRLNYGGAERQLVLLANTLRAAGHSVVVFVFYDGNDLESDLRAAGVRVRSLRKKGRWDIAGFLRRLVQAIAHERPNVLHSYLGVPNIVAAAIKPFFPSMRVVWAVRAADMPADCYGPLPRALETVARLLSRCPDLIIANSSAGRRHVVASGYPAPKVIVVPNGVDTDRFAPSADARLRFRQRWRIPPSDALVGLVARIDPVKGHATFLQAARLLAERKHVRFACVGDGPEPLKLALRQQAEALGLGDALTWIPAQADVNAVYNGLDVLCSSSVSEGFPNVVAEAMACGVPCVVTDVGDSALVTGPEGCVVPPRDATALADGIRRLLDVLPAERARMARANREWIVSQFSVITLRRRSEQAILSLRT